MESIVVTVSGYHGFERLKLIKLITHAGANYVGKMSRSTTHLICWKFEGKKYELAKSFGTIILNHRWLEDCYKKGKQMPERPYTLRSGREEGSIFNFPVLTERSGLLSENKLLSKKRNVFDSLNDVIDLDSDGIQNGDSDDDWLLDESLFPRPESREVIPQRSKRKVRDTLVEHWQPRENFRRPIREPQIPVIERCQVESVSCASTRTYLAKSARRTRRLVKKDVENNINRDHRRLETASSRDGGNEDDKIKLLNHVDTVGDSRLHSTDTSCCKEQSLHETGCEVNNSDSHIDDRDSVDDSTTLPTSLELSCVICWTEFSSIRGVLPCGHRFCFSCIQNWADHMASNRKQSTCPLCKASFASITRVDDAASLDQKIYSQTIPNPSSLCDIFIVPEGREGPSETMIHRQSVCCTCQSSYPIDLLIYCQTCQSTCVHSYCLDPPLFPWTCNSCRDRRLFYHH